MLLPFADHRLRVPPHVISRVVGGSTVLLNSATGRYFTLDEVGTRAWTVLISSESMQVAFDTLLSEYRVDAAQLQSDLEALVTTLDAQGLLEVCRR
jgi:hypothetical protein